MHFRQVDHPPPSCILCTGSPGATDPRVKYIHQAAHMTIGEKRNVAIANATGEFICHFDDDDLYAPMYAEARVRGWEGWEGHSGFEIGIEWLGIIGRECWGQGWREAWCRAGLGSGRLEAGSNQGRVGTVEMKVALGRVRVGAGHHFPLLPNHLNRLPACPFPLTPPPSCPPWTARYVETMLAALQQKNADFVKLSAWFVHDLQVSGGPARAPAPPPHPASTLMPASAALPLSFSFAAPPLLYPPTKAAPAGR
jgi:glycosyltransferase involved in cell wall biosynthesis